MILTCDKCHRTHRGWRTYTRCRYPDAAWITGDGPIAVIAWCDVTTISLHDDLVTARAALDFLARTRCGHACRRDHTIRDVRSAS